MKPDALLPGPGGADEWVSGRKAVVALSLADAFDLAQEHWVARAKRAGV